MSTNTHIDKPEGQLIDESAVMHQRVAELESSVREHKRVQESLKQEVQISKGRIGTLESILDCIGEGVVAADGNGDFLYYNPEAERILGKGATKTSPEEWVEAYGVVGKDGVTPVVTEDLPLVRAMRGEWTNEAELVVRNPKIGKGTHVAVTGRPLKNERGDPEGGVVVFRDIIKQKQVEEKLLRYHDRLRSLTSQLTLIEERERRRIAADLHIILDKLWLFRKSKWEDFEQHSPPPVRSQSPTK